MVDVDLVNCVLPFERAILERPEYMGNSVHVTYILDYLSDLSAKTCILEKEYIDKDFTIDYQKFYCRSFSDHNKCTKRIHFFNKLLDLNYFTDMLTCTENYDDDEKINELNEWYLGFTVIRPIKDEYGCELVGRTMLRTYPSEVDGKKRVYISSQDYASLFGIPLKIESLPFQSQDRGVSACATIALWGAIHPIKNIFGVSGHSPAEITEMATSLPSFHRRFPTSGLTKEQMINYIKLLGLDMEIIKPKSIDSIPITIKAFINAGLPIIASLKISKKTGADDEHDEVCDLISSADQGDGITEQRHAVIITGYQADTKGCIKELYVHDDKVGPYCKVLPKSDFFSWDYELSIRNDVKLEDLKVPIYPKVRTTFPRILGEYMRVKKENEKCLKSDIIKKLKVVYASDVGGKIEQKASELMQAYDMELFLTSVKDYKKYLLSQKVDNKITIMMMSLPRFLWVMRLTNNGNTMIDSIYDTTSVSAKKLVNIKYIRK